MAITRFLATEKEMKALKLVGGVLIEKVTLLAGTEVGASAEVMSIEDGEKILVRIVAILPIERSGGRSDVALKRAY